MVRAVPHEIGVIGEISVRDAFSADDSPERGIDLPFTDSSRQRERLPSVKAALKRHGVTLDDTMKSILRETQEGLAEIKKQLRDEYGDICIIGRGQSRNGLLSGWIKPDFVALADKQKNPILIEVKNTRIVAKQHDFQAEFYNSIGRRFGVTVMDERVDSDLQSLVPISTSRQIRETVLIYPRLGEIKRVTNEIRLDTKMINDIWRTKQLGIMGKVPKTDCDSKCPHRKFGKLPENNMQAVVPLSLVYSKGWDEQDVDLDDRYLRQFLIQKGLARVIYDGLFETALHRVRLNHLIQDPAKLNDALGKLAEKRKEFIAGITETTGLKPNFVKTVKSYRPNMDVYNKKAEREMAGEMDSWKKILGARRLKIAKSSAKSGATAVYVLPKRSKNFIRRSWREWE